MDLSLLLQGSKELQRMNELKNECIYLTLIYTFSEAAETAKQYATGVNLDGRPLRINFGKVW